MKSLLLSTALVFSLCSCGNSNVKPVKDKTANRITVPEAGLGVQLEYSSSVARDTATLIKDIKNQYAAINSKLNTYKKKEENLSGLSAEGGALTGYYQQSDLVKEQVVLYAETGKVELENYYNKGVLIFQYKKEIFYDKPIYEKGFKVKNTIENRFYFHKRALLKWLGNDNKIIPPGTESFKQEEDTILRTLADIHAARD